MHIDDFSADKEAQAQTLFSFRFAVIELIKRLGDLGELIGDDPWALVVDAHFEFRVLLVQGTVELHVASCRRELDGVGPEIGEDLRDPPAAGHQIRQIGRDKALKMDLFLPSVQRPQEPQRLGCADSG